MCLPYAAAAPVRTDPRRMGEESKGVVLMTKKIRRLAVLTAFVMLLTLVPLSVSAETKMSVTGNFVRLRDVNTNQVIGTYNAGTIVTVLSTGNGYMYKVRVDNDDKVGMMYREYLKSYTGSSGNTGKAGGNAKPAVNPSSNYAPVARNNDTVRATITKQTNVRATANQYSRVVGTLKTRTTVSVLSQKGNSVYITTSKMSGYVPSNSVMMNNVTARAATVKNVKNGNYNIYTGSTGKGKVVGSVKSNNQITVLHQGSTWSYVKVGNTYGYIASNVYTVNKKS